MPRREPLVVVLALALAGAARGEAVAVEDAVARALEAHAEVRAAAAEVRAARARLSGASAWLASNPALSGEAGRLGGEPAWTVGLSQPVEVAGQRGARVDGARAALGAAEARLAAVRARVASELREAVAGAIAARLRAEVAAQASVFASAAARAAERRVEAGDAAPVEGTVSRLEWARAVRAAAEADAALAEARVELAVLLGADPAEPPELALALDAVTAPAREDAAALAARALAERQDLVAARLELRAAEAEERLAGRAAAPTPALGLTVGQEEGASLVLGTLALELPVFARNQAERGAASARVQQARAALSAAERRAAAEVRVAAERLDAAWRVVEAFDPATGAALAAELAAAVKAYEAGRLDFATLGLLRREAGNARLDRIDALEAFHRARVRLERALGR